MTTIRPLDPHDDADFAAFHRVMCAAQSHERPWYTAPSIESSRPYYDRDQPDTARHVHVLASGGEVVGASIITTFLHGNTDCCVVLVLVDPDHRRRGLGTTLLEHALRTARGLARTKILGDVSHAFEHNHHPTIAWLERHGFRVAHTDHLRVLTVPVAEERLTALHATHDERWSGYDITLHHDGLPDDDLEETAALLNRINVEAPLGDLGLSEGARTATSLREEYAAYASRGDTVLNALARRDGHVVGFSDIVVATDSATAFQRGTIVHADHRGHGLALAMKLALLPELPHRAPGVRRVRTLNAAVNAPMIAVNDAVGFHPVAVSVMLRKDLT